MSSIIDLIRVDDRSATSPVVLHVPHASRCIPDEFRPSFVVPPLEVEAELDALTDASTDRIADAVPHVGRVQHGLSRLLLDVERFPGDEEEMNVVGMGVLYTHGSRRQELRRPSHADRDALLAYFAAYSAAFAALVERTLKEHGRAIIIDVHSYPATPSPYELHADEGRPEICTGADAFHTSAGLLSAVRSAFEGHELLENEPFHGSYVPLRFSRRDERVQSVMVEIRRDLYLDRRGIAVEDAVRNLADRVRVLVDGIERAPRPAPRSGAADRWT
jgi:N-formylglutamate amidohydrolase